MTELFKRLLALRGKQVVVVINGEGLQGLLVDVDDQLFEILFEGVSHFINRNATDLIVEAPLEEK